MLRTREAPPLRRPRAFYAVIAISILVGMGMAAVVMAVPLVLAVLP